MYRVITWIFISPSTTQNALTAHLIMPNGFNDEFMSELQEKLKDEFGIVHTTFQVENEKIEKV